MQRRLASRPGWKRVLDRQFGVMYLDVVVLSSGETVLLDADEIEAALQEGKISHDQYRLAWEESRHFLHLIANGAMPLLHLSVDHLARYFPG